MEVNYQVCIRRMENFEDFIHCGNTMSGYNTYDRDNNYIKLIKIYQYDYAIYSYNTLICFVDFIGKTYCVNPNKYSTTTSKQKSYIRQAAKSWEYYNGYKNILWI